MLSNGGKGERKRGQLSVPIPSTTLRDYAVSKIIILIIICVTLRHLYKVSEAVAGYAGKSSYCIKKSNVF